MKYKIQVLLSAIVVLLPGLTGINNQAYALAVNITQDLESVPVHHGSEFISIQRIQNQSNVLKGGFTKTSRKCPPFCIQPLKIAPGVTTVAELELLKFIDEKLEVEKGLVIDARTPSWHQKGTIPGSVNIPFTHFDPEKSIKELANTLTLLNVRKKSGRGGSIMDSLRSLFSGKSDDVDSPWDFSKAKDVLLYCNGNWCGQSPTAIKNLLAIGFPAEKIYYYRGGMQSWQSLGLTVYIPEK